ncbi:hypothetical protein QP027_10260 [Corynebacterium breve]|uniref:Antitoxin VbhA domain-containing protein n=1 Tax=Corynebacterium breve TaxID=3049799 RepID=A0ABY8VGS8_9CORY|nr:hypothetical protein [Corynebacterium breve]WIM67473.1 hypothetical protein QP027_10260 [Corynebacterium breve]
MHSQETRASLAKQATHSLYLEGLLPSPDHTNDTKSYVAGEITADELVSMTRARFGLS